MYETCHNKRIISSRFLHATNLSVLSVRFSQVKRSFFLMHCFQCSRWNGRLTVWKAITLVPDEIEQRASQQFTSLALEVVYSETLDKGLVAFFFRDFDLRMRGHSPVGGSAGSLPTI